MARVPAEKFTPALAADEIATDVLSPTQFAEPRDDADARKGDGEPVAGWTPDPAMERAWDELEVKPTDGLTVYRMSSLGGDLSQLVAGALQYESVMPGYLLKYLQEGRDAEDTIVAMFNEEFGKRDATYPELAALTKAGIIAGYDPVKDPVTGSGGPVLWLRVGTTSLVKGHADRIVCINPKSEKNHAFAVVEAKKFRPSTWTDWQKAKAATKKGDDLFAGPLFTKYGWQVSALHHATGLPVYFVVGQFNVDTNEIDKIDVTLINGDQTPHSLAEIKARVIKAKKHVDAGTVPTCEYADDGCPYAAEDFCPGKPEKLAVDTHDVELGRLLGLYYAYTVDMQITDEQKQAEKDRTKIKAQIDKHMAASDYARSVSADDAHVYRVWDDAGNEYEYEWVTYPIGARGATVGNKVNVKLVIDATAVAPEDHPE